MPHLPAWLAGRGRSSLRAPDVKAERPPFAVSLAALGPARWSGRDPATLAREGYARNAVVYRCVRMVAEAAASIPLAVFDRGVRAPDHPLQRLLDRPSPDASGVDLLESWLAGLQIAGSAYLQCQGPDEGPPSELYPLRADRVRPVAGADGWPAAWSYDTGDGRPLTMPRPQVLQLTLYNPLDDLPGQSPLTACAAAVDASGLCTVSGRSVERAGEQGAVGAGRVVGWREYVWRVLCARGRREAEAPGAVSAQ